MQTKPTTAKTRGPGMTVSSRWSTRLAAALAAGLAVLVAGGLGRAGASENGASEKLVSFAGSCSLEGTTSFTPPATNTQQPLTTVYDADGTCSGTLEGMGLSNEPVKMHNVAPSYGACPYARTTAPGDGVITFSDGTAIRYSFEFTSVYTEIDLTMQGERAGSAKAHATFLTPRTPPDVTLKCAGDGVAEIPMDLSLTTESPLVSEYPAVAPDTTITAGPKARTKRKAVSFSFTSTELGSTYECRLDADAFESCASPKRYKVGKGKHHFEVRARDAGGSVDATPANQSWTRKK
jgi:hypothetical protein